MVCDFYAPKHTAAAADDLLRRYNRETGRADAAATAVVRVDGYYDDMAIMMLHCSTESKRSVTRCGY